MSAPEAHESATDAWWSMANAIKYVGKNVNSRVGPSREVLGASVLIRNASQNVNVVPGRKYSPWYGAAELLWYLSGESLTERIAAYAPSYAQYAEDDGRAHGAYGARIADDAAFHAVRPIGSPCTQLEAIVALLRDKPDTRQAVLSLWNAGDLVHALLGDKRDLPCTLSLQFLLRDGKLNLIATMRSNDLWLGFPYDVYCFTAIQQIVAGVLGVDDGWYVHQVGSLHLYESDAPKLMNARDPGYSYRDWRYPARVKSLDAVKAALDLEYEMRAALGTLTRERVVQRVNESCEPGSVLADAVLACGIKWMLARAGDLASPLMQDAAARRGLTEFVEGAKA